MIRLKGSDLKHIWKSFTISEGEDDFYTIYSHYHHYLSYIGYKRYFSEDVVKDAINDVFLYLWENKSDLQTVNNYHNYIITCFLRKLYRKNIIAPEEMDELQDVPIMLLSPSVEDQYIQQGMNGTVIQIVKDHINQLAAKQRNMVYQKFYLGLSYQEIAITNKVSINTVYNTIYKAIDKLKSTITKEQETYLLIAIGTMILFFLFFQIQ
ncbi:RNA polymerase sigma factor (sigma-70 family) [Pedobacter cryoconitis]|uniref:RNA polymerase sigma factor (Sigma-70 family) n=1 Tax=Pedobacter cryoconitis TaxID=188932 RepID=A0A7W9DXL0_9SPHI|nr:sigma factor-like helix-turn-helix DNA-binding protein [Pedobacter cryoconitis]MBB5635242.1 RNA polymerase sigma factor (sigma-70 family) [Pedobacter cryoconitis]MBB6271575.1 RNA polymerase sigma factor (sigma-70 family) [Pedobacter cryoconitis]